MKYKTKFVTPDRLCANYSSPKENTTKYLRCKHDYDTQTPKASDISGLSD